MLNSMRLMAVLAVVCTLLVACGDKEPPEITKKIDCAHGDLTVSITKVTHTRDSSRSTVKTTFTVKCKGVAVTTGYQVRTKITGFSEEKLADAAPDSAGSATVNRVEQLDPGDAKITVTVKSTDGSEVTSDSAVIPKA